MASPALKQELHLAGTHLRKALAAINRAIALGLEGYAGLVAAGSADRREELTGAAGSGLAGVAAGLAALGLILEATLSIELLLAGGEYELLSAFLAHKGLVFVHFGSSLLKFFPVGHILRSAFAVVARGHFCQLAPDALDGIIHGLAIPPGGGCHFLIG